MTTAGKPEPAAGRSSAHAPAVAARALRPTIAPGAHIELRDAVWRVVRVDPTHDGTAAWRCVGVSEIVRDREAVFLEALEGQVPVLDPRTTKLVQDTSPQHRAGLLYMEALLRDLPPPDDALYIGHRAAMDVLDFQLEPAWRALQRPRARILIADAVGLGKTLEAGILLAELIRRGRARRILVATTKAMLTQFQKEMWARFAIPLVRLDSVGLDRVRRELPSHHNPFYAYDRAIVSIDTLKQHAWFRTHVEQAHWDVVVIDEAHNVAARGRRSMRSQIATVLSERCDHLILLSATPHDGRAASFASLMNLLDPTAIADPDRYGPDDIRGLYVRRFKHHVQDQLTKHIPPRDVREVHATATPEEEAAFQALLRVQPRGERRSGGLLFRTTLEKALFSSPAAAIATATARIGRLDRRADGDAAEAGELEALVAALERVTPDRFAKYQRLLKLLRDELKWSPRKKDDRLVVFTERLDTLQFLERHLVADLGLKEGQWEVLHGGSDIEQQRIVEDFGKEKAKVRLLLASDVAAEGLNLHYLCHRLVHFDVPWSLMTFQQRNGRIDRYGQTEPPQIVYLLTDAADPKIRGDQRIVEILIRKDLQARDNIGDPSAFMNRYDVQDEEAVTGEAIERALSPEAFSAELDANLDDPFAALFEAAATDATSTAPRAEPTSLFGSDFVYLEAALERLGEPSPAAAGREPVRATVRPADRLIELPWTSDLRRRMRQVPVEAHPTQGPALLTDDPDRMQRALADARRQEQAWPVHQFLWANHPVFVWVGDRLRAEFPRHSAPLLVFPGLPADHSAVVVSGLLPNRRGQALVHRWYAARFDGDRLTGVEPFEPFARSVGFGRAPMPNSRALVDLPSLQRRLPAAVDAVAGRLVQDRDAFRSRLGPALTEQLARLETLRGRQLSFWAEKYADRAEQRAQATGRVQRVFDEHDRWVRDAMTVAEVPFLQVIAVLVGPSLSREGA